MAGPAVELAQATRASVELGGHAHCEGGEAAGVRASSANYGDVPTMVAVGNALYVEA
jgi:hypothetical protein